MPLAVAPDFEEAIDRLYGLPLDEFTGAGNELAKRAREYGERALAARIKELRKPNVPAWVVNRLVRDRELDIQRLLKAGERLAESQLATVSGRDRADFAEARRDEQRAVAQLAKAARELLERAGHGAGSVDRVTRTLRAAAVSEEGRQLLKHGRLTEDLEPQGFEALAGATLRPAKRPARPAPAAEARRRVRELEKQERALVRKAEAAERDAEHAAQQAEELRRHVVPRRPRRRRQPRRGRSSKTDTRSTGLGHDSVCVVLLRGSSRRSSGRCFRRGRRRSFRSWSCPAR